MYLFFARTAVALSSVTEFGRENALIPVERKFVEEGILTDAVPSTVHQTHVPPLPHPICCSPIRVDWLQRNIKITWGFFFYLEVIVHSL